MSDTSARSVVTSRPLLALVLMIKDEIEGVGHTLNSTLPYCDHAIIVDTGSADGTQALVRGILDAHPHLSVAVIVEEPFVDFATTRNKALEHASRWLSSAAFDGATGHDDKELDVDDMPVFLFMPDADEILSGGPNLRAFLESKRDDTAACYGVRMRCGPDEYTLPLVMRTDSAARYVGRIHEYLNAIAQENVPGIQVTKIPKAKSQERSRERWKLDRDMLAADVSDQPQNARAWFYLGQTLHRLGDLAGALRAYETRVALGKEGASPTWADETFEAMRCRAKIMTEIGRPWALIERAYLECHLFDPRRAEPLYAIASHYFAKDQHALALLFAGRAAALPVPQTAMFIERDIYEWRAHDIVAVSAFYVGQQIGDPLTLEAGRLSSHASVRARPGHQQLRNTRAFLAPSASEAYPSSRMIPVDYQPQAPYHPGSPSIAYDDVLGEWRCVLRTTNYRIVDGQYLTPDDNVIYTRNVMLELNDQLGVTAAHLIGDPPALAGMERTDFPVHGWEDCRLFRANEGWRVSATACDLPLQPRHGARELVQLPLNEWARWAPRGADGWSFSDCKPMRGAWSKHHQKNWMPLQRGGGEGVFVYRIDPDVVILDASTPDDVDPGPCGRLRGGSQVVFPDGLKLWVANAETGLCLVHEVAFPGGTQRIYIHRFAAVDITNRKLLALSDPFYFRKRGIEFCAGLALGPVKLGESDHERLVASFSVDDSSSFFCVFEVDQVLASLRKDFVI